MILAAQGVAGGVDGGAAGGAKGQARIVGGQQEVVEQREAALRPLLGDGLIAPDDHLNGLIAKELGVGGGLGGQGGLHRVDQASMELAANTLNGRPSSSWGISTA